MTETLFAPPLTFLNLPLSRDFRAARIVLLGIPFDCGRDPTRFGAHTDSWPLAGADRCDNATQFTHATKEGLIDMAHAIHIGVRGPVNATRAVEHARGLGYEVIPFEEVRARREQRLLAHLRERVSGCKVCLCLDVDFFDPSAAPGVSLPTPGGATAAEGLGILRGLEGLDIVAVDVNAMTPVHDPSGATAVLAASALAECLALVA